MPNPKNDIQTLRALNQELENYFRNTIIPQLFIDSGLILKKFTPPAMKQFNLALDDVGRPIAEIVNNLRFPTIVENIEQVLNTRELLEKEIQTTDLRWHQMNILPYIALEDNKIHGVIVTFIEITSRIRDLKEQEALIAEYETLVDSLSHDIKTPLTSLLLAIAVMKKSPQADQPYLLGRLETGIGKIKLLVDELTQARQSEHAFKGAEELLSVQHVIEDVRLTLRDDIAATGTNLFQDMEVSQLLFPRRKLRTIIYNLVNNAIKYRSDLPPVITISARREDKAFVMTIQDNGIGIAPEQQELIFQKYFQVNKSGDGIGMGLYLVREMVQSTGGMLSVESTPGKGSVFTMRFENR